MKILFYNIMLIIILVLSILASIKYNNLKKENELLNNKLYNCELIIKTQDIKLKSYKDKITGLNQELEQTKIKLMGLQLAYKDITERYKITKSYSDMAEYILINMGIEFRQVEVE